MNVEEDKGICAGGAFVDGDTDAMKLIKQFENPTLTILSSHGLQVVSVYEYICMTAERHMLAYDSTPSVALCLKHIILKLGCMLQVALVLVEDLPGGWELKSIIRI